MWIRCFSLFYLRSATSHVFVFWTVHVTEQNIWRCHLGHFSLFSLFVIAQTINCLIDQHLILHKQALPGILWIPDRMLLSSSIFEEEQLQQFGFSQGVFLTPGQCRMTDWDKDKMAGPVWDYTVWTCFHSHWYGASSPSNGGRQTQGSLAYSRCNHSALCRKHRAQFNVFFHYYRSAFVGVCTSVCLCVWGREDSLQQCASLCE